MEKLNNFNMLDYLKWRGDLSFESDPFNEIDALILARFSYLELDDIVDSSNKEISIKEAFLAYDATKDKRVLYWPDDITLFSLMAESVRFSSLSLSHYIDKASEKKIEQFSAVTIKLDEAHYFLSFRGTDNTINGWKEDLLMTFDDEVASQEDALKYLTYVTEEHNDAFFSLGGHSKGGNLAIFASLSCKEEITKRIRGVFSFDGPGLHKNIIDKIESSSILPNVTTYIPQSSIFGKMLNHAEHIVMVHSSATGAMQHDVYSWSLMQKSFQIEQEETASSRVFDQAFHNYLSSLDKKERETVVKVIFDAIDECDMKTMDDLNKHLVSTILKVMNHLGHLEKKDSAIVKEALGILGSSFKDGIIEELSSFIPHSDDTKEKTN